MSPQTKDYDVIIVGAGPAGIAFAKTLNSKSPEARILLIEKDKYPRDKLCGDAFCYTTIPLIQEIFPELKNNYPTENLQNRFTIWYPNGEHIQQTHLELDILPRMEFDNQLFETIQNTNIKILENTHVKDLIFKDDKVIGIQTIQANEEKPLYADLIVGADGSKSIVRRKTGPIEHDNTVVTIRQYVKNIPPPKDGFIFFIDPDNVGYFWIFPFNREGTWWANIGYGCKKANPREEYLKYLENPKVKEYLGSGEIQGDIKGFPLNLASIKLFNRIFFNRPLWENGYVLLGDAACLIHPHTGEGISGALFSGKLAAEIYSKNHSFEDNHQAYKKGLKQFINDTFDMGESTILFHLPHILPKIIRPLYYKVIPKLCAKTK